MYTSSMLGSRTARTCCGAYSLGIKRHKLHDGHHGHEHAASHLPHRRAGEPAERAQGGGHESGCADSRYASASSSGLVPTSSSVSSSSSSSMSVCVVDHVHVAQRSSAWHALRADRLTASSFGGVIGFFSHQREQLWLEKTGLGPAFTGNAFTRWGTRVEDAAVLRYAELTGSSVDKEGFRCYGAWLGASPDGLIGEDGVLEVKCPSKPSPDAASPYESMPLYYMPQVQGLMHIFDREYCDLYAWTSRNGSALFRVQRDEEYWKMMEEDLRCFWFDHVLPAREILRRQPAGASALGGGGGGGGGDSAVHNGRGVRDAHEFNPGSHSGNARALKARGRAIAKRAVESRFEPQAPP